MIEEALDGGIWRDTRILIDGIPGHSLYNGGRLAFGPGGMLYLTPGWTDERILEALVVGGDVYVITTPPSPRRDVGSDNRLIRLVS